MDMKHLQRKPSGLYMYHRRVPKALTARYPNNYITESLNTHCLKDAQLKRDAMNMRLTLRARYIKGDEDVYRELYKQAFEEYSEMFKDQELVPEEDASGNTVFVPVAHTLDHEDLGLNPVTEKYKVEAFYDVTRQGVKRVPLTISELHDEYKSFYEANGSKNDKYLASVGTAINKLVAFLESNVLAEGLTLGQAQRFVDHLVVQGLSHSTITHYRTKLADVWKWGTSREKVVTTNHWNELTIDTGKSQKETKEYELFEHDEVRELFARTQPEALTSRTWSYPNALYYLLRILPFMGLRRNELTLARKEQLIDMDGISCFSVLGGKSHNAKRIIPVPSFIEPLFEELKQSDGDYLFPEIMNASIGASEASNSISSKFGKIIKQSGASSTKKTALHSLVSLRQHSIDIGR